MIVEIEALEGASADRAEYSISFRQNDYLVGAGTTSTDVICFIFIIILESSPF